MKNIKSSTKILVSVICTNYNKGSWICDAIDSFLAQETKFNFEIIIIDDNSTDESIDLIKRYAKRYPKIIRDYYNDTNLGITRTWIKACKKAKGKYIARCDGDDYWIDRKKLQKQVDLLEHSKDSKWCNTDFDIMNKDSDIIAKSAFENNIITKVKNYNDMLVDKGFTMASTWLVDAELMKTINSNINEDAVDDTFNIQLELFQRTKLTYLSDSTTMYRMLEDSDSHIVDIKKNRNRQDRLLKTQEEYVKKYNNNDLLLVKLLKKKANLENNINDMNNKINELENNNKNQEALISDLQKELEEVYSSKRYKLSKIIVSPILIAKSIQNKGLKETSKKIAKKTVFRDKELKNWVKKRLTKYTKRGKDEDN